LFGHYDAKAGRFTDAAGKFLDHYRQNHKASSLDRWTRAMHVLSGTFGAKRLDEISSFAVEAFKAQRKEAGMADASVNRELACLRSLFYAAQRWGWVRENPVGGGKVRFFRENNARERFLTDAEIETLLAKCDPKARVFVTAAVDTGFRAAELQALRWVGVDFGRNVVTVASGYTKNGDSRTNPMTRRLAAALLDWRQASGGQADGQVFGEYRYREPFERARAAAKLGDDVCFHTLRHTYISRLVLAGADIRTVQELAGHRTITMTMRYAHLGPEHKRRAVGLLESEIGAEVTAKVTTGDFRKVAAGAASA
jgi:integrase